MRTIGQRVAKGITFMGSRFVQSAASGVSERAVRNAEAELRSHTSADRELESRLLAISAAAWRPTREAL